MAGWRMMPYRSHRHFGSVTSATEAETSGRRYGVPQAARLLWESRDACYDRPSHEDQGNRAGRGGGNSNGSRRRRGHKPLPELRMAHAPVQCRLRQWQVGRGADGKGTSGPGASLEATTQYRAFLENFIRSHDVKSVVDAGGGDWSFSSHIDWNYAHDTVIHISTDVIADVRRLYGSSTVAFEVGNITESLPSAQPGLCEDVLQHLPNELVQRFIRYNLRPGKYKWVIVTNDRWTGRPRHCGRRTARDCSQRGPLRGKGARGSSDSVSGRHRRQGVANA
jgi:hypothetical protein